MSVAGVTNLFLLETIDSAKIATVVNNQWLKLEKGKALNVMVQVNASSEESKRSLAFSIITSSLKW